MKLDLNQTLKACAIAAALAAVTAPAANAALILEISDGVTTKRVTDGGVGDGAAAPGLVFFNDSIGGFDINMTSGSSKPIIGSETTPKLALNSLNISGGDGGLIIRLTDTDFRGPISDSVAYLSEFSGITSGVVTLDTYIDNNNAEFGLTTPVASFEYAGGGYSDSDITYVTTSDLFSLTLVATIEHFDRGNNKGQFTMLNGAVSVPEPGTLGMVGGSLVLMQIARRRRSLRKA